MISIIHFIYTTGTLDFYTTTGKFSVLQNNGHWGKQTKGSQSHRFTSAKKRGSFMRVTLLMQSLNRTYERKS